MICGLERNENIFLSACNEKEIIVMNVTITLEFLLEVVGGSKFHLDLVI
jgi:hypothetical protein